jgi:hypothetical protein
MFSRWCARPDRARLFTGEDVPHAARRLLQQIRPTNTPTELPDLDLTGADESAPIERPSVFLNRAPCEQERADRVCSAQGLRCTQHPTETTARSDGFTPT